MEKPKKKNLEYYDYFECEKYIKEKYQINDKNLRKFWLYLCSYYNMNNGSYIILYGDNIEEDGNEDDPLFNKMNMYFISEFANENNDVCMRTWW